MVESIRFKVHTWLADHVKGIQYPRHPQPKQSMHPFFRHQIPLWQRIAMLQLGLFTTFAGLFLSAVGLFFAYLLVMAIISTW